MVEFEQDVNDLTKFWYCTLSLMLVGDDKIDGDTILFFLGVVCPKGWSRLLHRKRENKIC